MLPMESETLATIFRSIWFASLATIFSALPGIPLGIFLAWKASKVRHVIFTIVRSISALPTVTIGLLVYSVISRSGPLGSFNWLYAPAGVVIGQWLLALPLVISVTATAYSRLDVRFIETLETLSVPVLCRVWYALREASSALVSATMLAFSRVIGEVGVSMMLGGNIRGYTRTMTTAIALEAARGEFEKAIILGIVLMAIAVIVNLFIEHLMHQG